ncbi:MAG: aminopeptidase N, partial [Actinobacteria bacterium]|nr:aminopeptidase N [Actinomycetota bacterium]
MANNLTRDEARERARLLSVAGYRVELDLTGGETTFTAVTTVSFGCERPGADSFIDLTAPAVTSIILNGDPVPVTAFDGNRIALTGLAAENELRVTAECAYSRHGEGLHRFTDPADGGVYLYSDLETFDAHRIYPCFDQPDLKGTFELTVTAPAGWQVISNMAPDVAGGPADGSGGQAPGAEAAPARWHFPPTPVMSTYITAVAAGPYHAVRSEYDGIPLGIFCRQSLAQYLDPAEIFEVTRQGFAFYHREFGRRYPFGKYDQLFVPEYKAGAMENAGCVTFLEDYLFRSRVTDFAREGRAGTILHEMAHMWFGDLVTMRWWDDLWLNESFATWAGTTAQAEATRWPFAWTTFAQLEKAWAYRQDQLPSTHPIAADIPDIAAVEVNFDGITYAKGASVLKQLVAYVGRDSFLAGVRRYFGQHEWSNATLADLLGALEEISGRQLSGWSKEWLEAAGVNTLRPEITTDAQGRFTEFAVTQEAPDAHPVLRSHRIAVGLYDRTDAGLVRRRRVEADIAGGRTVLPELAGEPRPDLVLVNDDDLTYAKIRLDPHSLATLVNSIGEFTEPLPAALCWAAAWDMCRDAELAARDYLRLVLSGLPSVTGISVAQTLLRQASAALRQYADPAWRPAGLELASSTLRELADRAEPGSDAQLAYVQA